MISKQYIKDLEFKTIEDTFDYIEESYINGAISQAKELSLKLSKNQARLFLNYFDTEQGQTIRNKFIQWRI